MFKATAFILIGGKSERFGSPKWQTVVNGQTVLDRIWGACDIFEYRYIVGKEKPQGMEKPYIKDGLDINAPINGLYTALKNTKTDWILLLSCDLPLINSKIFEKLWELKSDTCDAIIPTANGKTQVTSGFYHRRIFEKLKFETLKEHYSLYNFLDMIETQFVDFGDDNRFINMNTKCDLDNIKTIIKSHSL